MTSSMAAARIVDQPPAAEPAAVTAEAATGVESAPGLHERRHALVLRAWEATNTERTLQEVLAAMTAVVCPAVPYLGVGVIAFDSPGERPYALHHVEHGAIDPRTTEARFPEDARRMPSRPIVPYEGSAFARTLGAGEPFGSGDMWAQEAWLKHESKLVRAGARAYVALPLVSQGRRIGHLVFCRQAPVAFSGDERQILQDIARAVAVAVSNALANEEIRRLRDQLEAENIALRAQLGEPPNFGDVIGTSPALRRALEAIEQVAATDATVLLTGETGTGKELAVRALHRLSPRSRAPLVKVNCAAIPETLVAAELFGHERGAFTGAVERRKGRFEQAHGGTLFLDEIGELPLDVQVLLLRVLQERELERLGGNETIKVDVRVVTATNRDLSEDVRAGRFRGDLFYRLNVFPIRLPPLRDRAEDIPLLAAHFAEKHARRLRRTIDRIDRTTMRLLETYGWPGNVRELENVIERAVILAPHGTLRVDAAMLSGGPIAGALDGAPLASSLRARERQTIEEALRASSGRIAGPQGAALRLGLPASTLEFRIRRLGIDKFRFRRA